MRHTNRSFYVRDLSIKYGRENLKRCGDAKKDLSHIKKGTPKRLHFNSISVEARVGGTLCPSGRLSPNIQIFPSIILIRHHGTAARHGSGRSQQPHHPQVYFICHLRPLLILSAAEPSPILILIVCQFRPLSIAIMSFVAPGTFAFLSKDYGEFSTGNFDPNRAYDPNSLAELSKWRKEFLDGRYGPKQPTPPSTPRSLSLSFPIPVIVGRQMFPGDEGYVSEDDEILLPPPPVPPQIFHPPPNVPEIGVGPIHDGQQPIPLRVLPQIAHRQLNFPVVRVQPMQQGHEPLPLRDMPQFANPPPNVPAIRVQPVQQPIPLRDVPLFANPPRNVPVIRAGPIHGGQQPMPLRDMPQIHHPPRNVTSIWIKLWLLFLSLWVFLQAIHVRQIQREYAVPQFAHPPPNVPLIFDHSPAIQPWQQPLPLRDVPPFDHPLPHRPPNHPNPPRVLEVIRRLREWRGRPRDPRRPPK
ncbi:hypothetical protein niasHT_012039 [Heterodera trifolii]|uniref:Uncharacterized protein n=1 Tax=Heterodera trifolii TaxID=157864 RepID=A0ABD2KTR4_9BILA